MSENAVTLSEHAMSVNERTSLSRRKSLSPERRYGHLRNVSNPKERESLAKVLDKCNIGDVMDAKLDFLCEHFGNADGLRRAVHIGPP